MAGQPLPPVVGRAANADAWAGHVSAFPDHVVYPHRIVESGGRWRRWGTRPDRPLGPRVIWVADVRD